MARAQTIYINRDELSQSYNGPTFAHRALARIDLRNDVPRSKPPGMRPVEIQPEVKNYGNQSDSRAARRSSGNSRDVGGGRGDVERFPVLGARSTGRRVTPAHPYAEERAHHAPSRRGA